MNKKNKRFTIELGPLKIHIPILLIVLALIVLLALMFLPGLRDFLGIGKFPTSFKDLMPDKLMGYNETKVVQAILGESRDKAELVVMEQDVSVEMEVSRTFANIPLFEKSKMIYTYGKGAFAVDLSLLTEGAISFDHDKKEIILSIPHAFLAYTEPEYEKTEFGETKKALLAFGDIKLTQEQQNLLNLEIHDAMKEELSKSNRLATADLRAVQRVKELINPVLASTDNTYKLKVIQK